jgi:phage/plasmid-associated DNA primase
VSEKPSIKIIKRNTVETSAIHTTSQPKTATNETKVERRARREMVNTVANWISEKREQRRVEEVSAVRKLFGGEPLLS